MSLHKFTQTSFSFWKKLDKVKTAWQLERTFIIVWLGRETAADTEQFVDRGDDVQVRCIIFELLIGTVNEKTKKE